MEKIFVLKLENGASFEARAEEELGVKPGDMCVFQRDFFEDIAEVVRALPAPSMTANPGDLPPVKRIATAADHTAAHENFARERKAMHSAAEWVETLKLPMKLINAHYSVDGKLVTIQFSADGRVDFRELVKELSRALSTRIELRQIGVRDESGIYGGIAVCGQALCCCRFLHEFSSINVKMAKEQDLSLTPSTISGVCGRLKCCLKYEHAGYLEMEKSMPRKGELCDTPSGRGKVIDRNILTGRLTVSFESGGVASFNASEVETLRGEKRQNNNNSGNREKRQSNNNSGNREKRNGGQQERRHHKEHTPAAGGAEKQE